MFSLCNVWEDSWAWSGSAIMGEPLKKGTGSVWYSSVPCDLESNAKSFRSWWEVQNWSQHYQVVEEETGLIDWDQVGWQHPMFGRRQQMQDWYRRRDRPDLEDSGDKTVDRLWWYGRSSRPFWGIRRNVMQAGNSAWWTRDDGRKTKVQ